MRIIYGEIEPGIRIGKYLLGSTKEEILPRLEDYKVLGKRRWILHIFF